MVYVFGKNKQVISFVLVIVKQKNFLESFVVIFGDRILCGAHSSHDFR